MSKFIQICRWMLLECYFWVSKLCDCRQSEQYFADQQKIKPPSFKSLDEFFFRCKIQIKIKAQSSVLILKAFCDPTGVNFDFYSHDL